MEIQELKYLVLKKCLTTIFKISSLHSSLKAVDMRDFMDVCKHANIVKASTRKYIKNTRYPGKCKKYHRNMHQSTLSKIYRSSWLKYEL